MLGGARLVDYATRERPIGSVWVHIGYIFRVPVKVDFARAVWVNSNAHSKVQLTKPLVLLALTY
jgi:hypothetical protein